LTVVSWPLLFRSVRERPITEVVAEQAMEGEVVEGAAANWVGVQLGEGAEVAVGLGVACCPQASISFPGGR
jgi:hypothetical protein